jgi:hypothetical protein
LGLPFLNYLSLTNLFGLRQLVIDKQHETTIRSGKREGILEKRLFTNFEVPSRLFIGGTTETTKNLKTMVKNPGRNSTNKSPEYKSEVVLLASVSSEMNHVSFIFDMLVGTHRWCDQGCAVGCIKIFKRIISVIRSISTMKVECLRLSNQAFDITARNAS